MTSARDNRADAFAKTASAFLLLGFMLVAVNCETFVPRHSWSRKWGPMVPHQTFPGDCGVCHLDTSWSVLREEFSFDHERETGFKLEGAHDQAACLRCHNDRGPIHVYTARGCGGCHVEPHKGNLGLDCTDCHNQDIWEPTGLIAEHAHTLEIFGAR